MLVVDVVDSVADVVIAVAVAVVRGEEVNGMTRRSGTLPFPSTNQQL